MAFTVRQRLHEIGIRVALGASRTQVLKMVLGQSTAVVGAGIIFGLVGSIGIARAVSTMLYGVEPGDPVTFGAVAAVLAMVAMLASSIPAHRATRVDPAIALRNE
jgi:putative ABC transport system permease protein